MKAQIGPGRSVNRRALRKLTARISLSNACNPSTPWQSPASDERRYRLSGARPRKGIEPPRTTRWTDRFTVAQSFGSAARLVS
jgi:hypothetical protein